MILLLEDVVAIYCQLFIAKIILVLSMLVYAN
jgi:hypothetical protein